MSVHPLKRSGDVSDRELLNLTIVIDPPVKLKQLRSSSIHCSGITHRCQLDSQPQTTLCSRRGVAWEFEISFVFVRNLSAKEVRKKIMLRLNQPAHFELLGELSTSAAHLLWEVRAFEAACDHTGPPQRIKED
jgi:hypothetical protein